MALPLLPAEHIAQKFAHISICIRDDDIMMVELREYMKRQWIESTCHPAVTLSVYGLGLRTINDTEAFHRVLNKKIVEAHINVYKLIGELHEIATDVRITSALVNLNKLYRDQKKPYKRNNITLQHHFDDYFNNIITAEDLLLRGSYLINPSDDAMIVFYDDDNNDI